MSEQNWKPGEIALLAQNGGVLACRAPKECRVEGHGYAEGDHWHYLQPIGGASWDSKGDRPGRRLVVIDPEDHEEVERLLRSQWRAFGNENRFHADDVPGLVEGVQAALREYANPTPSKPEEPTGLGAVVEDDDGCTWVRDEVSGMFPWRKVITGDQNSWAGVDAVEVLSEGVPQ